MCFGRKVFEEIMAEDVANSPRPTQGLKKPSGPTEEKPQAIPDQTHS